MSCQADNAQADTGQRRGQDLARQRRAARDFSGVISLFCLDPLARQPGGQDQAAEGNQVHGHRNRIRQKGLPDEREWGEEQQVDPATGTGACRAPKL